MNIHELNSAIFEFNSLGDHIGCASRFIICYLLKIEYCESVEGLNKKIKLLNGTEKFKKVMVNLLGRAYVKAVETSRVDNGKHIITGNIALIELLGRIKYNSYDENERSKLNRCIECIGKIQIESVRYLIGCETPESEEYKPIERIIVGSANDIDIFQFAKAFLEIGDLNVNKNAQQSNMEYPSFLKALFVCCTKSYECQTIKWTSLHGEISIGELLSSEVHKESLNTILKSTSYAKVNMKDYTKEIDIYYSENGGDDKDTTNSVEDYFGYNVGVGPGEKIHLVLSVTHMCC